MLFHSPSFRAGALTLTFANKMKTPQKPAIAGNRVMGGAFRDEEKNFTFVVWAFRALTDFEMRFSYSEWNRQRDKRRSLKNQQIDVISNLGM